MLFMVMLHGGGGPCGIWGWRTKVRVVCLTRTSLTNEIGQIVPSRDTNTH